MRLQSGPSLAAQVYRVVLDEICDGVLAPGTHLVQEPLADRLGVSRQPVQQAISLLKADGLVEEDGRRGVRVVPLDTARMRHHYEIRGALDGLAARCAAGRMSRDPELAQESGLQGHAILAAGVEAVRDGAIRELIRRDEEFHSFLYDLSGNPLVARSAEPHWRFLRRCMGEVLRRAESPDGIWRQHARILEAVLTGDAGAAESLTVAHTREAAERLARALESRR